MTRAELLKVLATCAESADKEAVHAKADEALLEFIDDAEVTTAFRAVGGWYA